MPIYVNSSRHFLDKFAEEAGRACPAGALMLDAGAGHAPYRKHFQHARYEAADICWLPHEYGEIKYVCDLTRIPVEDGRFDFVFCSQTLEHVPDPRAVLEEFHRVMAQDAALWISVPFQYEEHEQPWDFYRYTQFGLRHLLERSGFEVVRLEWLEGYLGTVAYQLKNAAKYIAAAPRHFGSDLRGRIFWLAANALRPAFAIGAMVLSRADIRHPYRSGGGCKNYAVVARKANRR